MQVVVVVVVVDLDCGNIPHIAMPIPVTLILIPVVRYIRFDCIVSIDRSMSSHFDCSYYHDYLVLLVVLRHLLMTWYIDNIPRSS